MFGFWKKEWEKTSRMLKEELEKRIGLEKQLSDEKRKADQLLSNQEKAIKALIADNMTGYIKCGNEIYKVVVLCFSGSEGELPEIRCMVMKNA